jgi:hypothetical protein
VCPCLATAVGRLALQAAPRPASGRLALQPPGRAGRQASWRGGGGNATSALALALCTGYGVPYAAPGCPPAGGLRCFSAPRAVGCRRSAGPGLVCEAGCCLFWLLVAPHCAPQRRHAVPRPLPAHPGGSGQRRSGGCSHRRVRGTGQHPGGRDTFCAGAPPVAPRRAAACSAAAVGAARAAGRARTHRAGCFAGVAALFWAGNSLTTRPPAPARSAKPWTAVFQKFPQLETAIYFAFWCVPASWRA